MHGRASKDVESGGVEEQARLQPRTARLRRAANKCAVLVPRSLYLPLATTLLLALLMCIVVPIFLKYKDDKPKFGTIAETADLNNVYAINLTNFNNVKSASTAEERLAAYRTMRAENKMHYELSLTFTSLDPLASMISGFFQLRAVADGEQQPGWGDDGTSFFLMLNSEQHNITADDVMPQYRETNISMMNGVPYHLYPMDSYSGTLEIKAYYELIDTEESYRTYIDYWGPFDNWQFSKPLSKEDKAYLREDADAYPVPMLIAPAPSLLNHNLRITYEPKVCAETNYTHINKMNVKWECGVLTYSVQRTDFAKAFVIFIHVLMWILSVYVLCVALDHVYIRPRRIEADTIGYTVGVLFALPGMREVLPEIPGIGAGVDMLGIMWNMAFVALAIIILINGAIAQYKHKARIFCKDDEENE